MKSDENSKKLSENEFNYEALAQFMIREQRLNNEPDLERLSLDYLRNHAKSFPNKDYSPIRWKDDGLKDKTYPNGEIYGDAEKDDIDESKQKVSDQENIWLFSKKTVHSLNHLITQIIKRENLSTDNKTIFLPSIMFDDCRIINFDLPPKEIANIHYSLVFYKCQFLNQVIASELSFYKFMCNSCYFYEKVDFWGCQFSDQTIFINTSFLGVALFCNTTFKCGLYFVNCRFHNYVDFEKSRIRLPLSFRYSHFSEALDLRRSVFIHDYYHKDDGHWLDFGRIRITGRTALMGDLRLSMNQIAFIARYSLDKHGRLLGERYEDLDPKVIYGSDNVHFGKTKFSFMLNTTLHLKRNEYVPRVVLKPWEMDYPKKKKIACLEYAAEQYSLLAGNFAASNEPDSWELADWCHSKRLDILRKLAKIKKNSNEHWGRLAYKYIFGNGIYWHYPIICAVFIILFFTCLYSFVVPDKVRTSNVSSVHYDSQQHISLNIKDDSHLIDSKTNERQRNEPNALMNYGNEINVKEKESTETKDLFCLSDIDSLFERFKTSLYFSTITFTTIGYGDWHPVGDARLFAASEGLLGLIMTASFTVILVRRIIR